MWHDRTVPVFIMILVALAALAVLVGVVYVVLGKGRQLARFEADYPPLDLPEEGSVRAPDLNRLVLPLAMWGYHVRAVDELLVRLAATLRAREERIQDLEWRLSRLDPSYVPEGTGPGRSTRLPGDAYAPTAASGSGAAPEPDSKTRPESAARPQDPARRESADHSASPTGRDSATRPDAPTGPNSASEPGAASGPERRGASGDLREQA